MDPLIPKIRWGKVTWQDHMTEKPQHSVMLGEFSRSLHTFKVGRVPTSRWLCLPHSCLDFLLCTEVPFPVGGRWLEASYTLDFRCSPKARELKAVLPGWVHGPVPLPQLLGGLKQQLEPRGLKLAW